FRIVFFRTREALLFLNGDAALWARFTGHLEATRWHPSLAIAGLLAAVSLVLYALVLRGRERQNPWIARLVTVSVVGSIGIALFYSLLFFGAVDRTFLHVEGGLLELVLDAPWPLVLVAPAVG